jgi:hypothetical protein
MRVVHAAALTAAALLLTSITSAQGLGDAAAREREKRKATPAKPAKVYTDQEVASSPTTSSVDVPAASTPADSGGAEAKADSGTGASTTAASSEGQTPEQKAAAEEAKAAAAEAEARAKAQADWRARLDAARQNAAQQTELIARLNAELGDLSQVTYGPGRDRKMKLLEETQAKLTETQANIANLEDEGRRNGY